MKQITKWSDDLYTTIYDMSKTMNDQQIARSLCIGINTLKKWRETKPALDKAMTKARNGHKMKQSDALPTFLQYVEDRIPEDIKEAWHAVMHIDRDPNGIRRVERHVARLGTHAKQHLFVHALVHANFIAAEACRLTSTPYATYVEWKESDPDFGEILKHVHQMKKDFFDQCLTDGCAAGEPGLIRFANETFNADRYPKANVKVQLDGNVNHDHQHEHVHKLDASDLPTEMLEQLEKLMKEKQVTVIDVPMLESHNAKR
jgi:hypothetical protein